MRGSSAVLRKAEMWNAEVFPRFFCSQYFFVSPIDRATTDMFPAVRLSVMDIFMPCLLFFYAGENLHIHWNLKIIIIFLQLGLYREFVFPRNSLPRYSLRLFESGTAIWLAAPRVLNKRSNVNERVGPVSSPTCLLIRWNLKRQRAGRERIGPILRSTISRFQCTAQVCVQLK